MNKLIIGVALLATNLAVADVVDFENPDDVFKFVEGYSPRQELAWSESGGIGGSGAAGLINEDLGTSSAHYAERSFDFSAVGTVIGISTTYLLRPEYVMPFGVIYPGNAQTYGQLRLMSDLQYNEFGERTLAHNAGFSFAAVEGPDGWYDYLNVCLFPPTGSLGMCEFRQQFDYGTFVQGNWLKADVLIENLGGAMGWNVTITDLGPDGMTFPMTVANYSFTTSDLAELTTDASVYVGLTFSTFTASRVDNFTVEVIEPVTRGRLKAKKPSKSNRRK